MRIQPKWGWKSLIKMQYHFVDVSRHKSFYAPREYVHIKPQVEKRSAHARSLHKNTSTTKYQGNISPLKHIAVLSPAQWVPLRSRGGECGQRKEIEKEQQIESEGRPVNNVSCLKFIIQSFSIPKSKKGGSQKTSLPRINNIISSTHL